MINGLLDRVHKTKNWLTRVYYTKRVKQRAVEYGDDLRVGGRTVVNSNTYLGDNVNFRGLIVYGEGRLEIGDNFHSGPGCEIITQNHDYQSEALPYADGAYIRDPVIIGDNVWIGQGVMILPGVYIGEGAVIQAGSVVVDDIPSLKIAGGHPAEVFSERDQDRYEKLKAAEKFH